MSLLLLLKEGEAAEGTLEAITGEATARTRSAVLTGTVKPGGAAAKYWFEISEGTGPPEPPEPGIRPDNVTESVLFPTGETAVEHEHAGSAEATTAVVYLWHFDANVVGVSAVEYGGVPMERVADEVRGASPWPGVQIWVADGVPPGPQTVEITKHTSVRLRAIAQTLVADGAVVVGDADAGSGNNSEPAVPALTASGGGLALGIVGGMWADLPTERAEDVLIQRDEGAQVYDAQMGYVAAGSHVLDWGFGGAANNARAGVVLLDPDPPGPPKEFRASVEEGDFSEFDHVQSLPERASVDDETATEGERSWRLEVQEGDEEPDTGDERSEPVSGLLYTEGDKPYFAFDFLIESHDPGHWMLIHQVHDDGGDEPPVALFLWHDEDENPILLLQHGSGSPQYWEAPRPPLGEWHRVVYPVEISSAEGFVGPVWLDGDQMTMLNGEETTGPFNTSGIQPAYDKGGPGIYRSKDSTGTAVVRGDNLRILRTFESTTPETTEAVDEDVPVTAEIGDLKPDTAYYFRLFARSAEGLVVGEDEAFVTAKPPPVAVLREFPPDQLAVRITDSDTDRTIARWAEDEKGAPNVISGVKKSGEMPGGHNELSGSLGRDPRIDYPDLEIFNGVVLEGPGRERVWEGRLDKGPKSDGERLVIEPAAVGWQRALEDDKGLIGPAFITSDLGRWGDSSTARRKALGLSDYRLDAAMNAGWRGDGSDPPGITFDFNGVSSAAGKTDLGEAWFYGGGCDIGALLYHFANLIGSGNVEIWETRGFLSPGDLGPGPGGESGVDSGEDHNGFTNGDPYERVDAAGPSRKYALLASARAETGGGEVALPDLQSWEHPIVLGHNDLDLRGTYPEVGYTAAQMLAYAIPLFASPLVIDEELLEDNGYIIREAWFSEPGPMSEVVKELTKYGLDDWFVFGGKKFQLRVPGTYGRRWQAYAGPSELKEAGLDGERLWESILVVYQDEAGRTLTVGPPGSGAHVEEEGLRITDPDHPAVRAGITRKDALIIGGSTPARATEAGERWLREANELSRSGSAVLKGYIPDDRNVFRPVSQLQPGDFIRFPDAGGDRGYRKIVAVDYDHDARTATVTLDAPGDGVKALLERMQADLASLKV